MFIKDMEQVTLAKEEELIKSKKNLLLILKDVHHEFTVAHNLLVTDNPESGEYWSLNFLEVLEDVKKAIAFLENNEPIKTNLKSFDKGQMRVYNT